MFLQVWVKVLHSKARFCSLWKHITLLSETKDSAVYAHKKLVVEHVSHFDTPTIQSQTSNHAQYSIAKLFIDTRYCRYFCLDYNTTCTAPACQPNVTNKRRRVRKIEWTDNGKSQVNVSIKLNNTGKPNKGNVTKVCHRLEIQECHSGIHRYVTCCKYKNGKYKNVTQVYTGMSQVVNTRMSHRYIQVCHRL